MYSRTRFAGHAIHPMLVVFPIAFYTVTVATLLAYVGTEDAFWYRVAMIAAIAGIITAGIAVLPGAIDLMWLPATSRARTVGVRHAGMSALATGLFAVTAVLLYRGWHHPVLVDGRYMIDPTIPLATSIGGWGVMTIAASLGWTLVQAHRVGVKSAFHQADRVTRELELNVTVYDALADNLGHVDRHHSPAAKEAPPLSMHS